MALPRPHSANQAEADAPMSTWRRLTTSVVSTTTPRDMDGPHMSRATNCEAPAKTMPLMSPPSASVNPPWRARMPKASP